MAAVLAEVRKLLGNDEEALAAFEKHRSDRMEVASWSSSSSSSSSRVSASAQHIVEHYTTTQSPPRSGHERRAYGALILLAGKNQRASKDHVAAVLAEVRKLLENDEGALAAFEKHRSDRMEVASSSPRRPRRPRAESRRPRSTSWSTTPPLRAPHVSGRRGVPMTR